MTSCLVSSSGATNFHLGELYSRGDLGAEVCVWSRGNQKLKQFADRIQILTAEMIKI